MVAEVKAFKSDDGEVYVTFNDAKRADIKYWLKELHKDQYSGNTMTPDAIATQAILGKSAAESIKNAAKKLAEAVA